MVLDRPVAAPAPELDRGRLLAATSAATAFFSAQYDGSWAPAYLQSRLGASFTSDTAAGIGYAPAGWTTLVDHLRREGFSDAEILGAGLGAHARTGHLIDHFRDRLMFAVHQRSSTGLEVVGFTGRRNPDHDHASWQRAPKYLNTAATDLWTKGEHLYGLHAAGELVARGGLAVLVEGPVDKLAVDLATNQMMIGVSSLGTAITDDHAAALRAAVGERVDHVVVATDADPAGQQAEQRAYQLLTRHNLDPRAAVLPAGLDPAAVLEQRGPAELTTALASAGPLSRHLVDREIDHSDRQWAEGQLHAARAAAQVIVQAPPSTWQREIHHAATTHGLDAAALTVEIAAAVQAGPEALGRLTARDTREDLDRGQLVAGSTAQLAALSANPNTMRLHRSAPSISAEPALTAHHAATSSSRAGRQR